MQRVKIGVVDAGFKIEARDLVVEIDKPVEDKVKALIVNGSATFKNQLIQAGIDGDVLVIIIIKLQRLNDSFGVDAQRILVKTFSIHIKCKTGLSQGSLRVEQIANVQIAGYQIALVSDGVLLAGLHYKIGPKATDPALYYCFGYKIVVEAGKLPRHLYHSHFHQQVGHLDGWRLAGQPKRADVARTRRKGFNIGINKGFVEVGQAVHLHRADKACVGAIGDVEVAAADVANRPLHAAFDPDGVGHRKHRFGKVPDVAHIELRLTKGAVKMHFLDKIIKSFQVGIGKRKVEIYVGVVGNQQQIFYRNPDRAKADDARKLLEIEAAFFDESQILNSGADGVVVDDYRCGQQVQIEQLYVVVVDAAACNFGVGIFINKMCIAYLQIINLQLPGLWWWFSL